MLNWGEFASEAPTFAAAGEKLFRAFTLAFVATIRADGWPRVHPMTITVYDGAPFCLPCPLDAEGARLPPRRPLRVARLSASARSDARLLC